MQTETDTQVLETDTQIVEPAVVTATEAASTSEQLEPAAHTGEEGSTNLKRASEEPVDNSPSQKKTKADDTGL